MESGGQRQQLMGDSVAVVRGQNYKETLDKKKSGRFNPAN